MNSVITWFFSSLSFIIVIIRIETFLYNLEVPKRSKKTRPRMTKHGHDPSTTEEARRGLVRRNSGTRATKTNKG